jgi:hypothetical protein
VETTKKIGPGCKRKTERRVHYDAAAMRCRKATTTVTDWFVSEKEKVSPSNAACQSNASTPHRAFNIGPRNPWWEVKCVILFLHRHLVPLAPRTCMIGDGSRLGCSVQYKTPCCSILVYCTRYIAYYALVAVEHPEPEFVAPELSVLPHWPASW